VTRFIDHFNKRLVTTLYGSLLNTHTSDLSLLQSLPGNGSYRWRFFIFRVHVVTVRLISRNCQLSYSAVSSQPPLQSSTPLSTLNWVPGLRPFHTLLLVFSAHGDFLLTTELNCPSCLLFNSSERTTLKTVSIVVVLFAYRFRGNVFTEAFLRNGLLFIRPLHSSGCTRCLLLGYCLATSL
jgi:hypothetical protein